MSVSLLAPIAYVVLLFGPLYLFSKHYMGKQKFRTASATSWFPQHHARDIYVSLLSHQPSLPPHILSAALLRRAVTDVARVVQIRDAKAALSSLLQKSLIGDAFWNEFLEAEKELEAEIREVVEEANTFNPNWGKFIFAQASDMAQHEKFKNHAKELSTPMPKVQLVQQPPGQPGGQAGGPPRLPPNMTPEQVQKLQEATAKMSPQQRAAFQAQLALAQQQQAAKAAAGGASPAGGSGQSTPTTEASSQTGKAPLATSAQTNQAALATAGDASGSESGGGGAQGGQNQAPAGNKSKNKKGKGKKK